MAETGHKETFTNAMAEAGIEYIREIDSKFFQTIFSFSCSFNFHVVSL